MSYNYQPPKAPFDEQPHGHSNNFYDSIRSWRIRREPDRWIGGVAAGVAQATGLDTALVRGLAVILALLATPLMLVGYAVLWALVPERMDGRIHLEEFQYGRFDVAHLGIGIVALFGIFGVAGVFNINIDSNWSGYAAFLTVAASIAFVVVVIIIIARLVRDARHRSDMRGRVNQPYGPRPPYNWDSREQQGFQNAFEGMSPGAASAPASSALRQPSASSSSHSPMPGADTSSNTAPDAGSNSTAKDDDANSNSPGEQADRHASSDFDDHDQAGGAPMNHESSSRQGQGYADGRLNQPPTGEENRPEYRGPSNAQSYQGFGAQGGYGRGMGPNTPYGAPGAPNSQPFYPPLDSDQPSSYAPGRQIPPYVPPADRAPAEGPGVSTFLYITGVLLLVTAVTWLLWSMGILLDPAMIMTTTVGVAFVLTGVILGVRALRGKPGTWLTGLAIVVTVLLPGFLLMVAGITSYTDF